MVNVYTGNSAATVVPTCYVVCTYVTHTLSKSTSLQPHWHPFNMTAQRSVLFTFKVLLITRDDTRYLQHKVHSPKSLTHSGTCQGCRNTFKSKGAEHSPPKKSVNSNNAIILKMNTHYAKIVSQMFQKASTSRFQILPKYNLCLSLVDTKFLAISNMSNWSVLFLCIWRIVTWFRRGCDILDRRKAFRCRSTEKVLSAVAVVTIG